MSADGRAFDVVIVGAGLSGIAAAHHLQASCPGRSFVILEGRQALGGTWDLFRYPGIRSDSDMFTLGYGFRPWRSDAVIATGPRIRDYIRDAAEADGTLRHIRFGHRVTAASWESAAARWTVTVRTEEGSEQAFTCCFLFFCSGYYDYAQGHAPAFEGQASFQGRIVHPQHWPEDLDYTGQRVVVIGSGATAVTLLPAMAERAAHVTMLQRSPSYILPLPARDAVGGFLQRWLPAGVASGLIRWKNILASIAIYQFSRRRPEAVKRWLRTMAQRLGGPGLDVDRHLSPRYDPWDQRLCIAPDADIFKALRRGRASIVTDQIERFTPTGIRLVSGQELPADLIVTATGLRLQMLGGARLTVDGRPVDLGDTVSYKGLMASGVPNLALALGYTNASWTLKAELIARYVCRLLNHLQATQQDICVAVAQGDLGTLRPALDLSSGYVQRAVQALPRQGSRKPWRIHQNYLRDLLALRFARLEDGAMHFAPRGQLPGSTP